MFEGAVLQFIAAAARPMLTVDEVQAIPGRAFPVTAIFIRSEHSLNPA